MVDVSDIATPAFYKPQKGGMEYTIAKLAPVAGQVLVLQTPPEASLDQVLAVLSHINQLAPEGVHVACIDSNFRLMVTNVPEVVALLQKPEITH